ncbi:MAG: hypothetical protein J3K34DRAFT_415465 [Monoraphidium minutum]|nr:MAG: hypothetical protein J3K34DRAFT_415465 [Monoraphidium minutum]
MRAFTLAAAAVCLCALSALHAYILGISNAAPALECATACLPLRYSQRVRWLIGGTFCFPHCTPRRTLVFDDVIG